MSIDEIKKRVANYKEDYLPYFNNNGEMQEWNVMFKDVQFLLEQNQRLVEALGQIKYEYEQGSDDKVAYRMYKEACEAFKLLENMEE